VRIEKGTCRSPHTTAINQKLPYAEIFKLKPRSSLKSSKKGIQLTLFGIKVFKMFASDDMFKTYQNLAI
jgi:hypothetical protein